MNCYSSSLDYTTILSWLFNKHFTINVFFGLRHLIWLEASVQVKSSSFHLKDIWGGSSSTMHNLNRGPPLCLQIISLIIMVSFGLYSIMKGMSFGLFNWWYVLGATCMVASAFASFRIYEVCSLIAYRETASDLIRNPWLRKQSWVEKKRLDNINIIFHISVFTNALSFPIIT